MKELYPQCDPQLMEARMPKCPKAVFIIAFLVFLSQHGFAQRNRVGFFLNAAVFFPALENLGKGYGSGLGAVFFLTQNISAAFEWKYSQFNMDKKEGEFLKGSLIMTPLLASIRYKFQTGTFFSPYVFVGGGVFFNTVSLDDRISPEDQNVRKQKVKNGLGFYGGFGGSFKINQRISLFIEGLYLVRKADVETIFIDNSPGRTFEANLRSFSALIGLEYFY
jgi:opacity protein-like surface antigen